MAELICRICGGEISITGDYVIVINEQASELFYVHISCSYELP